MNFLGNILCVLPLFVCIFFLSPLAFELIISIIQSSNVIYGKKWNNLIIFLALAFEAFWNGSEFCAVNHITCHSWNIYGVCRRWWLSFLNFFTETCRAVAVEYIETEMHELSMREGIFFDPYEHVTMQNSERTSIASICHRDKLFSL